MCLMPLCLTSRANAACCCALRTTANDKLISNLGAKESQLSWLQLYLTPNTCTSGHLERASTTKKDIDSQNGPTKLM